jgi:hypothetical protein
MLGSGMRLPCSSSENLYSYPAFGSSTKAAFFHREDGTVVL